MSTKLPETIGRYRIVRLLGSGAMGDVYLAEDPHIDRQLAIKTVRVVGGTEADIEERKRRLLREARAAGKLLHPNVVALFDADDADGVLYLAFEYVEGQDLSRRAAVTPALTLRQVLTIGREVAQALDYAHGHGIVHRDIKPSNILIGPGGIAKVADFGIAKLRDGSTELTRTGSVVGSPQYMSPEQVRGEALDGRSDLFSLGVLLYELLCRHRPFGGDTLSTLVFEILAKEPLSVDQLRPGGFPPALVDLVHRLLAKDRDARPVTARDVATEIDQLLAQIPADTLDAQAVPGTPGPSRVAPGSSAAGQASATAAAAAAVPTTTLDSAPTLPSGALPPPPPPPPGAPPAAAPPVNPVPVAQVPATQPPIADTKAQDRPSPLDTGTYGKPSIGRHWPMWAAIALLLLGVAVGVGWWLARSDDASPVATTTQAEATSTSSPVLEPPTDASPTLAEDEAPQQEAETDAELDPAPTTPPASTTTVPPATTQPPAAQPPRSEPVSTPPTADRPPAQPSSPPAITPSEPTTPPPPTISTPPPPPVATSPPTTQPVDTTPDNQENPRLAAFDAAAKQAGRELNTGLTFQFKVRPENTIVKIQRRGDRSLVQGKVSKFDPDDSDAQVLELPAPGDYLITLIHDRHPDVVALVHASADRGRPHVVRLDMGRAANRTATRSRRSAATEWVSRGAFGFRSWPAKTVVFANGRRIGTAAELPGRRMPRSAALRLGNGRHELRLEVPGYAPRKMDLVVDDSAAQFMVQIPFDRAALEAQP